MEGWIYILLKLVWTEGDITVSLSGHENPLRPDGYLAEEWTASVYCQGLHTHMLLTVRPSVHFLQRGYLCAALCVQPCESRGCISIQFAPLKTHMRTPKVPLVCMTTILLLFPLCPGYLTNSVCHIQSAQFCFSSTSSTKRNQHLGSQYFS